MATTLMDPSHLHPDELDYEFKLRNIKSSEPNCVEKLNLCLVSEEGGHTIEHRDSQRLTRHTASRELQECETKFVEIANALNNAIQAADNGLTQQGQSRLIHIAGRVARLRTYTGDNELVTQLATKIQDLSCQLEVARESFGAGQQGAVALTDRIEALQPQPHGSSASQGAIRKTTNASLQQITPLNSQPSSTFGNLKKNPNVRESHVQTTQYSPPGNLDVTNSSPPSIHEYFRQRFNLAPAVRDLFEDSAIIDAHLPQSLPRQPHPTHTQRPTMTVVTNQPNRPQENIASGGHRIHQWTLRFDGGIRGLDVEDFLFRVERQASLYGVTNGALVIGIGSLLTGRAQQWYWTYQRQFQNATWEELKRALTNRYAPNRETDFEIRSKMEKRRQLPSESFNDFCQDVEALAVRLNRQISEGELVEVLRRNMAMPLRKALWREQTETVETLLRYCNDYERLCREEEQMATHRRQMRVQEISYQNDPNDYQLRSDTPISTMLNFGQVEALASNINNTNDLSICWNCRDIGHVFAQCSKPQMSVFCFTCGMNGVISVTCPKCSLNSKRGQQMSGSACPAPPNHQTFNRPPPPIPKTHPQNQFSRQ